jgi:hypothetical protein
MVAMVLVSSLLGLLPRTCADTVTVNSSSAVTFVNSGFVGGDFPSPFTMANFTAAQTGTAASVLTATPLVNLRGDSSFVPQNQNAGASARQRNPDCESRIVIAVLHHHSEDILPAPAA